MASPVLWLQVLALLFLPVSAQFFGFIIVMQQHGIKMLSFTSFQLRLPKLEWQMFKCQYRCL